MLAETRVELKLDIPAGGGGPSQLAGQDRPPAQTHMCVTRLAY